MATIVPVITDISERQDRSVLKVVWNGLNNANTTGCVIAFTEWADRSFHINGVFNTANVLIEGSNDGGNDFQPITDPQGNSINKTAAALEVVEEVAQLMRPRLVTSGAVSDIQVSAIIRRNTPPRT